MIFQKILLKFKVSKTTIKLRTAFQTEQFFWNCLCNYKRFSQVNKKSFFIPLFLPQLLFKISFKMTIAIELKNLLKKKINLFLNVKSSHYKMFPGKIKVNSISKQFYSKNKYPSLFLVSFFLYWKNNKRVLKRLMVN